MNTQNIDLPEKRLPRFVTGSTMRHVVVMTATGSVGLFCIFLVDFLSLLYIAQLGDPRLTAGVGAASQVIFLTSSVNIGLMIAVSALMSRALGQGDRSLARRLAASSLMILVATSTVVSFALMPLLPILLPKVGASADTYPVALSFLTIILPSNGIVALGMGLSAVLRAAGEAKLSMYITMIGAALTAVMDPLFIFVFGFGTNGAAIVAVLARTTLALSGLYFTVRVLDLVARPTIADLRIFAGRVFSVGIPAIMTNLATPVANAFLANIIKQYGDNVYAANSIIDRLVPLAFGALFALSGCVGPILGQNWGAQRYDRMKQVLKDSIRFMACYVAIVWVLLIVGHSLIAIAFRATGITAELLAFFCFLSGIMWFFNGLLFVSNASFNNLGFPLLSTAFNWGRATLGVVPFALTGAWIAGPKGLYAGVTLGSAFFGLAAIIAAFWTIRKLESRARAASELREKHV